MQRGQMRICPAESPFPERIPLLLGFLLERVQDLHPELCRRILALPGGGGMKEGREQRKKKLERKESKAWNELVLRCSG